MKLSLTPTEIFETIHMVSDENLDIRTITMGISLRDCISRDVNDVARRIYDKIHVMPSIWSKQGKIFPLNTVFQLSTNEFL